ncbi:MAG: arsenate reductase (glutaredoxin) [Phenylobacterium sp.]|nr:MAG: arsenate reductase (glutaredoxin) [Phenylobacterium sp.]
MSDITIFHNPSCGTSRNTLALLQEKGLAPKIVEYLKAGWTEPQLQALFRQMGVSARDVLRVRGTDAEARGLTDPKASDAAILKAMTENPVLVERPIVVTPKGAALCRPVERVLDLL